VNAALALSVGMARSWVALYTLRLPLEAREARRSEIDSDLWEQQWLAARRGDPVFGTAIEVLARMLLGVISDITWRVQAGAPARADRGIQMNEALYMRGMVAAGVILALILIVFGFRFVADAFLNSEVASGQAAFGAITLFAGAAVAAGLLTSRRKPLLSIGLVAVGAITFAVAWYWMLVITIPVAIVLITIAYLRTKRTGGATGSGGTRGTGVHRMETKETKSEGRWKWLLVVIGVSVATVVAMSAYAFSLEEWGEARTMIFNLGGLLLIGTALIALLLLLSDLIGSARRKTHS
jgi:hypothetical protein